MGDKDFIIKNGDRIAQMVLCPIVKAEFEVKDNLPESIRGEGGFGSTGKKLMSLTIDEIERYKGQINLKKINIQGQLKLKKEKS